MNAIEWLLDSDPAIRWQVMQDLTDAPPKQVAAERAKVATSRWITLRALRVLRWAEGAASDASA